MLITIGKQNKAVSAQYCQTPVQSVRRKIQIEDNIRVENGESMNVISFLVRGTQLMQQNTL